MVENKEILQPLLLGVFSAAIVAGYTAFMAARAKPKKNIEGAQESHKTGRLEQVYSVLGGYYWFMIILAVAGGYPSHTVMACWIVAISSFITNMAKAVLGASFKTQGSMSVAKAFLAFNYIISIISAFWLCMITFETVFK